MARRDVVEVVCDRCGRKENQNVSELPSPAGPEFEATFSNEKTSFGDLCRRCRNAVRGYYARILCKTEDKTEVEAVTEGADANQQQQEEIKKKHGFLGRG